METPQERLLEATKKQQEAQDALDLLRQDYEMEKVRLERVKEQVAFAMDDLREAKEEVRLAAEAYLEATE